MHVPHAAPYPDRSRFGLFRPGRSSTSPELRQHPQRRPSIHHMLYVAHYLFWTGDHAGGASVQPDGRRVTRSARFAPARGVTRKKCEEECPPRYAGCKKPRHAGGVWAMRGVQKGSLLAQLAMGSKTQTNEAKPQKDECRWL